ncbi:MAG: LacI family DNA-binding transcriptional regulator [Lachnospiraceae bacterium]
MKTKKVRLEDIAAKTGVSAVTVSNALAGKKGVSEAQREKILAAAQELGYRKGTFDPARHRILTVCVLVSQRYIGIGSSFYWEMYQNLVLVFSRENIFLNLEILQNEAPGAPLPTSLQKQDRIDAFVIIGMIKKPYLYRILQEMQAPTVLLDVSEPDKGLSSVLSANFVGMYRSTKTLIDLGHRRIGFVGTPEVSHNVRERAFGYRRAMEEAGLPIRPEWFLRDRTTGELENIVLPKELPSAFACSSDYAASYLYDALLQAGIRVPEEISLSSYDDYLYGHPLSGYLTSFHVDMEQMAEQTLQLLREKLAGEKGEKIVYVDSHMVMRGSAIRHVEPNG